METVSRTKGLASYLALSLTLCTVYYNTVVNSREGQLRNLNEAHARGVADTKTSEQHRAPLLRYKKVSDGNFAAAQADNTKRRTPDAAQKLALANFDSQNAKDVLTAFESTRKNALESCTPLLQDPLSSGMDQKYRAFCRGQKGQALQATDTAPRDYINIAGQHFIDMKARFSAFLKTKPSDFKLF